MSMDKDVIINRLNLIAKLLALNMLSNIESQKEKILKLNELGLKPDETIKIINATIEDVYSIIIKKNISSKRDILVYYFSDGEHGIRDVLDEFNKINQQISYGTVQNLWQKWMNIGIVEPIKSGSGHRMKKIVSLEDLGFKIPINDINNEKGLEENE
jgi:hypothetical protein